MACSSAKTEQVGAGIHLLPPRLLRRHVRHRAHRHARGGQGFGVEGAGRRVVRRYALTRPLRSPGAWTRGSPALSHVEGHPLPQGGEGCWLGKVSPNRNQNLGLLAHRSENVRRLDVAARDPFGVCCIQRVGLSEWRDRAIHRSAACHAPTQPALRATLSPGRGKTTLFFFIHCRTGPRACIGAQFALTEMTLVAACLLRRFEFSLRPGDRDPEPLTHLSLRPRGGLSMVLRK